MVYIFQGYIRDREYGLIEVSIENSERVIRPDLYYDCYCRHLKYTYTVLGSRIQKPALLYAKNFILA